MEQNISIIVTDKGNLTVDRVKQLYDQTIQNKEVIVFTDNSRYFQEKLTNYPVKIYGHKQLTIAFMQENIEGDYAIILNENENFSYNDSLEKMFLTMKKNQSDLSISSCVRYVKGEFHFSFTQDNQKIRSLSKNNFWLYTRKYFEFRKLSGILFKKELLIDLSKSEQSTVTKLLEQANNPIFDCNSHIVFREDTGYQSSRYKWERQAIPDFISDFELQIINENIEDKISIALCVNANYSQHLPTLLYSIAENCQSEVDVYLIYYDVNSKMLELVFQLNSLLRNVNIHLKKVSNWQYHTLSKINRQNSKLPLETYFRLLLPELLPDLNRVLYLDIDMLVVNDLTPLWKTSFDGNFLIAAPDYPMVQDEKSWGYYFLDENVGKGYINAGMILFNLDLFRKYNIFHRFMQFVIDTSRFYILDDQDAYNLFFNQHIKLTSIYNNFVLTSLNYQEFDEKNINIYHYCGYSTPKPWKIQNHLPLNQFRAIRQYREYKRRVMRLLNPSSNIAVVISLPNNIDQAMFKLETLDSQSNRNFDVYVFCSNKELTQMLKEKYSSSIFYIDDEFKIGLFLSQLKDNYQYLYFLLDNNRLENIDAFQELISVAQDYNTSLIASAYIIFSKAKNDYLFYDFNNKLVCVDDESYEQVSQWTFSEFRTIQGILFKFEDFCKQIDSLRGNELSEEIVLKNIYTNSNNKYYLSKRFWIREE